MIFAAGLGTRLKPMTNDKPKALVKIGKKNMLELQIQKLVANGFDEIIVNVHHFADLMTITIRELEQKFGIKIAISDERNFLLETGGGLKNAQPLLDGCEPFLVHNVDIFSEIDFREMMHKHQNSNCLATLAVRNRLSSRQLLFDEENLLCGWQNISTGEQNIVRNLLKFTSIAFSGVHIISPKIFPDIKETGSFSIIKTYLRLAKTKKIGQYSHSNGFWIDAGTPNSLKEAEKLLNNRLLT